MKNFLSNVGKKLRGEDTDEFSSEGEYVELSPNSEPETPKITVRPMILETFDDVKTILDILREGYTVVIVNIRPLKDKDVVELKRAINKLKKTVEAINGDIAGFGDDYLIITPSFATIHRGKHVAEPVGDETA